MKDCSEGPKLTPSDPDSKALMDKWVDLGSMITSEGVGWDGLSKRIGNLLGPMTLPLFAGNIYLQEPFKSQYHLSFSGSS